MNDLLIPYGINRTTGEIIEPEDAAQGKACGCICPACDVPLLSRHPKDLESRKHFAHDSRDEKYNPNKKCPLSGSASVAMMIRHIAGRAIGEEFYTPSLESKKKAICCRETLSFNIARELKNKITGITAHHEQNGIEPDLVIDIAGHKIAVELKYLARGSKFHRHSKADYSAVLYLDCDEFELQPLGLNVRRRFSEQALEFLLGNIGKKWNRHPREIIAFEKAQLKHKDSCINQKLSQWQSEGANEVPLITCNDCNEKWQPMLGEPENCPYCFLPNASTCV